MMRCGDHSAGRAGQGCELGGLGRKQRAGRKRCRQRRPGAGAPAAARTCAIERGSTPSGVDLLNISALPLKSLER